MLWKSATSCWVAPEEKVKEPPQRPPTRTSWTGQSRPPAAPSGTCRTGAGSRPRAIRRPEIHTVNTKPKIWSAVNYQIESVRLCGVRLGDEDDFLVGSFDEFDKGLVHGDGLLGALVLERELQHQPLVPVGLQHKTSLRGVSNSEITTFNLNSKHKNTHLFNVGFKKKTSQHFSKFKI